jgi:WD40 repeat protein
MVASGAEDKTVKLWDVRAGGLMHSLEGHRDAVWSVTFSPGGEMVSGAGDDTVKLWDVYTGRLVASFLSITNSQWLTYIPEGYFIGSEEAVCRVVMKFERDGHLYPAELFPRDNPNSRKVAEALARRKERDQPAERPMCRRRTIAGRGPGCWVKESHHVDLSPSVRSIADSPVAGLKE